VRIRHGWSFDGAEQHNGCEQLDVAPDVAKQWAAAGWAEKVDKPPSKSRTCRR
jgi:hypothetical protein